MRWKVWYDGGRVYGSDSCAWEDMPDDGVQLVRVYLRKGWREMSGCDFYFKAGDVIGSNSDSVESITGRYPGASVKRGRWTSDDEIARIRAKAD